MFRSYCPFSYFYDFSEKTYDGRIAPLELGLTTRFHISLPSWGKGVPSNYEITVNGDIELVGANPLEEATVVTDHAAEGTVEAGVMRFRFSGEMANIHVVDWNGVAHRNHRAHQTSVSTTVYLLGTAVANRMRSLRATVAEVDIIEQ